MQNGSPNTNNRRKHETTYRNQDFKELATFVNTRFKL